MTKYHNIKTKGYDSKKESRRARDLKLMEKAGLISDLREQVPFELVPKQQGERSVKYLADFVYREGKMMIVEDVKGLRTQSYIIKRKLFKLKYPEYIFRES